MTFDTTRADYVSCLGGPPGTTPNLDALAARSALFTHARSDSNSTNPSHVTLMSGLRAIDHGVRNHETQLPEDVDTLPEAMKRAGRTTAGFPSVRHLGSDLGWRGFDVLASVRQERSAAETTGLALEWLRQNGERPYFLWVHYWEPHMPYEPPPELARRFYPGDREAGSGPRLAEHPFFRTGPGARMLDWLGDTRDPEWARAMYAAEIHRADAELGRLLEAVGERTLVVVTADHGESLGEHGIFYAHTGLYEPQLAVPLVVHVPGARPLRSDAWVNGDSVAPTIAELAGVELRSPGQGPSLAALVRGDAGAGAPERPLVAHHAAHNAAVAVRQGPWKLIWPIQPEHRIYRRPELFDLGEDPAEEVDLSGREPERLEALRRAAEPWIAIGPLKRKRAPHLDAEAIERLRALGYVDD